MRRVSSFVYSVMPVTLMTSRRHARRRGLQRTSEDASESIEANMPDRLNAPENAVPNVSSLRSEGMMAAPPTTSLDKIRSQLALMRTENIKKVSGEKAALARQQWLQEKEKLQAQEALLDGAKLRPAMSKTDSLTSLIQREYSRANKPNDVFRSGKEVLDGVAQRDFLLQQRRFRDADEVLRKAGKEDVTKRFVKLAFTPSSEQTAMLVELLQRMRAQCVAEKKKLSSSSGALLDSDSSDVLERLVWVQVLEQISDEEVRLLWEANILDADTMAALFGETAAKESVSATNTSGEADGDTDDVSPAHSLLDEKIDYVQRLHYLQELTSTICETELGNVPSIDLAPTLVKVQRRQFADVSEEELRKLEEYGETAAMELSVADCQTKPTGAETPATTLRKPLAHVGVPAATLDRALTPSNTFLSAVAEKDAALRKSFEGLERIKREALLDPEFQEAVRFAHAIEEASVAPHIHGQAFGSDAVARAGKRDANEDKEEQTPPSRQAVSKRERRAARSRQFRGPMARSPYSPEVVPYFYNDMHSIVPPRGAFNLPDPTPTKSERAQTRGRRRRAHQHSRFRK